MGGDVYARLAPARAIAIGGGVQRELTDGWTMARTTPSSILEPEALLAATKKKDWLTAQVPGTVASSLAATGAWDWNHPRDIDAYDWWFRCDFGVDDPATARSYVLRFDGLATIADVWLNNARILQSDSMWLAPEVDVTNVIQNQNTLIIRFASLRKAFEKKRPRARWRTRVVEEQHLRWWRTTWLGRMPGWSPAAPAIGPWRGVVLEERARVTYERATLAATINGTDGVVDADIFVAGPGKKAGIRRAMLRSGHHETTLSVATEAGLTSLQGLLIIPKVERWWPHTHGASPLYEITLTIETADGTTTTSLGHVGFREVAIDRGSDGNGFALRINGLPCFARGSCWAPINATSLGGTRDEYREALMQVRNAGFNMVRVSGTMAYETEAFHDLCDELGIMVWQDFMFANMDYPTKDADFTERVRAEVTQVVGRLAHRPSLMVLCGGSEVFQQASMLGLPPDHWEQSLFTELLPSMCSTIAPSVAYVANSPMAGVLPFVANAGISHYYGVGAYLRPLEDARRANVRFASECLGFANVPEPRTIDLIAPPTEAVPHNPRWKARVPRDRGAGWDFEDVRDHYFRVLFDTDPMRIRYADVERYLAMSRVVTGEVMARTMSEWRRNESSCAGALIWMHRDLWPSAGWGIIDSTGLEKSAYWYLARVCAPVAMLLTDEGLNGLALHAVNDGAATIQADVNVTLWKGMTLVAEGTEAVTLSPRSASTLSADAILGRFTDVSYAYRFGPAGHDLAVATLRDRETGDAISECHHFPAGVGAMHADPELSAEAFPSDDGAWVLTVRCERPAIAVAVDVEGFVPSDSYFHMAPASTRLITLRPRGASGLPSGTVSALNGGQPTRIVARSDDEPSAQT